MKKTLIWFIIATMLFTMATLPTMVAAAEDDNLVDDPCINDDDVAVTFGKGWGHSGCANNFNDDEFGWEFSEESVTNDGTGSLKVFSSCHTHASQVLMSELEEGQTYIFSCWMKVIDAVLVTDEDAIDHTVAFGIGSKHDIATESPYVIAGEFADEEAKLPVGEWVYVEGEYTADQTMAYWVSLELWGYEATVLFDEIYVGKNGSPYKPLDPVYLSDLEAKSWVTYHAQSDDENPQYNAWFNRQEGLNANGNTNILIGGKEYEKGIQVHASDEERHKNGDGYATAEVVYDISAYTNQYNAFKCVFGGLTQVDSTVVGDNHTNYTEIYIDGELVFVSEETDNTKTLDIAVYIPEGSKEIRLVSVAGEEFNSEWYAWADARLVRDNGLIPTPTPAPTPEPTPEPTPTEVPPEATDAPADATDAPAPAEKKGCGSVVAAGSAVAVITLLGACVVLKKKH